MRLVEANSQRVKSDIVNIAKKTASFCDTGNSVTLKDRIENIRRVHDPAPMTNNFRNDNYRRRNYNYSPAAAAMTGANLEPLAQPARHSIGQRGRLNAIRAKEGNRPGKEEDNRPRPPPRVKMSIRDLDNDDARAHIESEPVQVLCFFNLFFLSLMFVIFASNFLQLISGAEA